MNIERFRVEPGKKVDLGEWDAHQTDGLKKKEGKKLAAELVDTLNQQQEMLYARDEDAILLVLQGMDTSGKDGVIKHVVGALNPQGCQVTGFKVPTREELAHDFLWRVHRATPRRGMVGIFNRSHYEDVVVVRVDELAPESVWRRRYGLINDFERLLSLNHVHIIKLFLHISPEEQRERLQDRLVNREDQWKFKVGDLEARRDWDAYMAAYEEALGRCSTEHAPWYVIPADKKWYRNLVVSHILLRTFQDLEMEWPPLEAEAQAIETII